MRSHVEIGSEEARLHKVAFDLNSGIINHVNVQFEDILEILVHDAKERNKENMSKFPYISPKEYVRMPFELSKFKIEYI